MYKMKMTFDNDFLEQVWIRLNLGKVSIGDGVIYRPPASNLQVFLDTFEETIAAIYTQCDNVVCTGDFNIDLLNANNKATQFKTKLDGIGLIQIIEEPTRITQNTFSLIDFFNNKFNIKF